MTLQSVVIIDKELRSQPDLQPPSGFYQFGLAWDYKVYSSGSKGVCNYKAYAVQSD